MFIQDRDLWRFQLENSWAIGMRLQSVPKTIQAYDRAVEEGSSFLEMARAEGEQMAKFLFSTAIQPALEHAQFKRLRVTGHSCIVVNTKGFVSEIGNYLTLHPKADFALIYSHSFPTRWNCGLRSSASYLPYLGDFGSRKSGSGTERGNDKLTSLMEVDNDDGKPSTTASSSSGLDPSRLWDWSYVQREVQPRAYGAVDVAAVAGRFGGGGLTTAARFGFNGKLTDLLQ